jgi:hypothetical protein
MQRPAQNSGLDLGNDRGQPLRPCPLGGLRKVSSVEERPCLGDSSLPAGFRCCKDAFNQGVQAVTSSIQFWIILFPLGVSTDSG